MQADIIKKNLCIQHLSGFPDSCITDTPRIKPWVPNSSLTLEKAFPGQGVRCSESCVLKIKSSSCYLSSGQSSISASGDPASFTRIRFLWKYFMWRKNCVKVQQSQTADFSCLVLRLTRLQYLPSSKQPFPFGHRQAFLHHITTAQPLPYNVVKVGGQGNRNICVVSVALLDAWENTHTSTPSFLLKLTKRKSQA